MRRFVGMLALIGVITSAVPGKAFAFGMPGLPGAGGFTSLMHHSPLHTSDGGENSESTGPLARVRSWMPAMPGVGDIRGKVGAVATSVKSHLPGVEDVKNRFSAVGSKLHDTFGSVTEKLHLFAVMGIIKKYLGKAASFVHLPIMF